MLASIGAWLANLLVTVIGPLIEKWWANHEASVQVTTLQVQVNDLVKAIALLQSAKTTQDNQNAIKAIAAADNANSQ